jgi:hypothetical protein
VSLLIEIVELSRIRYCLLTGSNWGDQALLTDSGPGLLVCVGVAGAVDVGGCFVEQLCSDKTRKAVKQPVAAMCCTMCCSKLDVFMWFSPG